MFAVLRAALDFSSHRLALIKVRISADNNNRRGSIDRPIARPLARSSVDPRENCARSQGLTARNNIIYILVKFRAVNAIVRLACGRRFVADIERVASPRDLNLTRIETAAGKTRRI